MLNWQGDYTLPRLRAKLALKHSVHPDVEPEYCEVYRPDLSQSVILRQDSLAAAAFGLSRNASSSKLASLGGGLARTQGSLSYGALNGAMKSPSGTMSNSCKFNFSRTMGGEIPWSQRSPERISSVPDLGTRRALVAPTTHYPAPPGAAVLTSSQSHKVIRRVRPPPEKPPPPPADDLRAIEREKQAELASRRLWVAANANQAYLSEELYQLLEEAKKSDTTLTNNQILSKMKTPKDCAQMAKARREGAKVDWTSPAWDGATLLIKAVRTNCLALVIHMLAIGANSQALDDSGRGILHWIAIEGNVEIANFVFETVPDLLFDEPDDGGDAPLHLAAYHGHLPIVRLLVRQGADILACNARDCTPVQLAESRRKWHVVTYLSEPKLLQEDQANAKPPKLLDLIRPCNQDRLTQMKEANDPLKAKK